MGGGSWLLLHTHIEDKNSCHPCHIYQQVRRPPLYTNINKGNSQCQLAHGEIPYSCLFSIFPEHPWTLLYQIILSQPYYHEYISLQTESGDSPMDTIVDTTALLDLLRAWWDTFLFQFQMSFFTRHHYFFQWYHYAAIKAMMDISVLRLTLKIPPQMKWHKQTHQSVHAISRGDISSFPFVHSEHTISWFQCKYTPHTCSFINISVPRFHLEMPLPKCQCKQQN